jgi:hypothetical protein
MYLPREELLDALRELCDRAFSHQMSAYGGADSILVERTPLHAQHLDLIGAVYPDAHVVHLIRDGHDVAASLVRQPWGPPTLAEAAAEWRDTVAKARSHSPARYREVRHEDLDADVVGQMRGLFEALDLETTDELLERIRAAARRRVNTTPGGGRPAGARWQRELEPRQVAEIEQVAGELLRELGYPVSADSPATPGPAASTPLRPARRLGRGRRSLATPTADGQRSATAVTGDQVQLVIDRLLAALEDGAADDVEPLLSPAVEIRLNDEGRVLNGSGGVGAAASALVESARPRGRQVRGESHPGSPSFTVVWAHEEVTGRVQRVFVITVDGSGLITRLDYYRSP